jgi:hypothetical protein
MIYQYEHAVSPLLGIQAFSCPGSMDSLTTFAPIRPILMGADFDCHGVRGRVNSHENKNFVDFGGNEE